MFLFFHNNGLKLSLEKHLDLARLDWLLYPRDLVFIFKASHIG
jgi:hypothetical protein